MAFRILRSTKNKAFKILADAGIQISTLECIDKEDLFAIKEETTGHYFIVTPGSQGYTYKVALSPGAIRWADSFLKSSPSELEDTLLAWSKRFAAEASEPDLYETARAGILGGIEFTSEAGVENTPFTDAERATILDRLKALEAKVAEQQELDESQRLFVATKIQYLIAESKYRGRLDWLQAAIGTAATIAIGIGYSTEQARTLLGHLITIVKAVFDELVPLLP